MFSDIFKGHRDVTLADLFHDGVPYHIETSLLICSANQQTSFYMIGTFSMKKVKWVT